MPRDITVTFQDGSTHVYKGAPDDVTPDAVSARASKEFGQSVTHLDGGRAAPAPRWDVLGDIGRAASESAGAFKQDFQHAFANPDPSKPETMDSNPLEQLKRTGAAFKLPLDALGVAASPITGAIHGTLGSALSYVMPTPDQDIDIPGPFGGHHYSDPKKAADHVLDTSMLGLGPGKMGDPAALASQGVERANLSTARTAAKNTNKAVAKVNQRMADDGLTPADVIAAQREAMASGDKVTLMDLGDKNVRGLAGAVHRAPGPAGKEIQSFLEGRDTAASTALTKDVGGLAKGSTYHTVKDLTDARSKASGPAYKEAENIGPVHSERLDQFLAQPEVQEGLRRGLKLERQTAIAENRPFVDSDYGVVGYKDGNWDMPIFGKVPTMKQLIVANEGLSAKVGEMVDQFGRLTKDGLAMKKFRDAYLGELDRLNPKYAKARQEWSGHSQSMEAVREGKQHFSKTESNEQIKAEFDALSPGDKDFYRMGAAEAKVDALERAPDASDKSKRVINSERDRKRFRILFGSDAEADRFIESVARKRKAFETKTDVIRGSQTAGRQIEDADHAPLGLHAAHGATQALGGNWLGAAKTLYNVKRDLGLRNNPGMNSEIARLLLEHNFPAGPGDSLIKSVAVPPRDYAGASALAAELLGAGNSSTPRNRQPR